MLDVKLMHPRDQIVLIISRIYNRGLTTTSGGNVSMIDENGDIWVTPSAVDKGSLQARDIMCVKKDGTIEGPHKPSSEFPFHKAIYDIRPDINAIIHAHPPALVSFSIVRKIPDTNIVAQAKHVCGPIGYAEYELPGSEALGEKIAATFGDAYSAIIMENHGTVVGGFDLADAFQRFETLEFCARTILYGRIIGAPTHLTDQQIEMFEHQRVSNLPEMASVDYPSDEREKRTALCNIVQRACRQGLMISAYGTVSTRWRNNDFLITPTNVHRWDLQANDIVQVKNGKREPGKYPSRGAMLHQAIYKRFPEINSIIITQPPNLMAFGITQTHFNVRTIPESWIFLQDVVSVPYGAQFGDFSGILNKLSKDHPAIILQNDAILITGDTLLQTFDRLEVAEFSANSILMSHSLGEMVPISEAQVEDLRKKFL
jgi:L-fuculose-phosphate aldolase